MPGDSSEGDAASAARPASLEGLTPREVVEALDRHVIGQPAAKRAVAIAVRDRARRRAVGEPLARDIVPRNILMIGPTGVGKTEIARRLARLTGSPFVKVEASKFTEVGYVGRDVESMVRDLTARAIQLVRDEQRAVVREQAESAAEDRLLALLVPPGSTGATSEGDPDARQRRMDAVRNQLRAGHLDDRRVEVEVSTPSAIGIPLFSGQGMENVDFDLSKILPEPFRGRKERKSVTVAEARESLLAEELERLVPEEAIQRCAVERVEESGIIFLDEIDKIAASGEGGRGPDVSREGVQRDLLPIVEGTTVQTKWGPVRTDHVLFLAAGAFHVSKPSDLIPELQGRFPVRVELSSLGKEDFVRILTEPAASLTRQTSALLATEGVTLTFTNDGVEAMADFATRVNASTEDIGARRLHTIMEAVIEDVSFEAPDRVGTRVVVDAAWVEEKLARIVEDQDYTRYVL